MNAINETGTNKGTVPAGGRKDVPRQLARKQKPKKEAKPAPAGGKDLAREVALRGEQDGMSKKGK